MRHTGSFALVLLIGCSTAVKVGEIKTKRDDFKKLTIITYETEVFIKEGAARWRPSFTLRATPEDPIGARVEIGPPVEYPYLRCGLDLLADDQVVPVDIPPGGEYAFLPAAGVLQIAGASTARGRWCGSEFSLTSEQIGKIKEFAARVGFKAGGPPQSAPQSSPQ